MSGQHARHGSEDDVGNCSVRPPIIMRLPCTASSVSVARQKLKSWMSELGGSGEHIEDARLVISELVANSVRHADPRADGRILAPGASDDGALALAAPAGGSGGRPRRLDPPPAALAGRGMAIVDALARKWWAEQ